MVLLFLGAVFGQTVRLGSEFRVNSGTAGYQGHPRIGRSPASGSFLVVWDSWPGDGSSSAVLGQMFDASGAPLGPEFRANTYTTGDQVFPDVSADGTGNFVVAWQSYRQDGSYYGVFGQRLNASGARLGSEFQVNATTSYDQNRPAVSSSPAGAFVVAWQDAARDGYGTGALAQRFDSAGAKQGGELLVNTYTTSSQGYPSIGVDPGGNFVVVWQSYGQDGSDRGIFAQRYTSGGQKSGSEFEVNNYTTGAQEYPHVAAGAAGFIVVWQSPQDGSGTGIYAQRYSSSGTKLGFEFRVNTYTINDQSNPAVAMAASGDFVAVWQSFGQDGSMAGIYGQRFTSTGTARGAEFRVNTATANSQARPDVDLDGSGNFVVTWQSYLQDGDGYGVYGQRFAGADCAALATTAPANQTVCLGGTAVFAVTASGTGPFTYQWRRGTVDLTDTASLSGSQSPTLTISNIQPSDLGSYTCVVKDFCLPTQSATSSAATLATNSIGPITGLQLQKVLRNSGIRFNWTNDPRATDYVVYEDSSPSGPFTTITGTAGSGTTGLTVPLPAGRRYYLVAGRNAACGVGSKN